MTLQPSLVLARFACALVLAAALTAPTSAQVGVPTGTFGVFTTIPDRPGILVLDDMVHYGSAGHFLWAIDTMGTPERLLLNSGGGSVEDALFIADAVRTLQIETEIPEGSICHSACVVIFLAGVGRTAIGELGVHEFVQALGETRIPNEAFTATSQDAFRRFGARQELIDLAWGTAYPAIHVLTPEEVVALGVNRTREEGLRLAAGEGYQDLSTSEADTELEPWQPIGEPVGGVDYIIRRAGMPDETYPGYVQWYGSLHQGVVVAEVVMPDLGIGYRFMFGPFSDDDEPYIYGAVYVTKLSTAGQVPMERIWEFGLAYDFGVAELGPGPHVMQIGQAARPVAYDTTGLLFPRILRESYVERLAKTEMVYLGLSLDGTTTNTVSIFFLVSETGREAFATALPKWDGIF